MAKPVSGQSIPMMHMILAPFTDKKQPKYTFFQQVSRVIVM
jgi:hypothetical protein